MSWRVASSLVPIFSGILIYLRGNIYQEYSERFQFKSPTLNESYDFIIVGAGSAGSVVAHRLAENKNWSVLLVEAGGEENVISVMPLLAPSLWNTDKDWNYTTVRQEHACLEFNGICQYPRGHGLGGSSSISFMFYVRGNEFDFDNWESQGNMGWSYKDVLPYFLKSENMSIPQLRKSMYHSTTGHLNVEGIRYSSPLQDYHVAAAKKVGFPENYDYNGKRQIGITLPQLTFSEGTRCSASRAFLTPIKNKKNIHIAKRTFVETINLSDNTNKVTGVRLNKDGRISDVTAKKEVILSAGAINSPKLLMLSGIGPKEHLKELDINPRYDLPVGENLVDHTVVSTYFKINKDITITRSRLSSTEDVLRFGMNRTGAYASSYGVSTMAFFTLKRTKANPNANPNVPDIQCYFSDFYSFQSEVPIVQIGFAKLRPKSVGNVRLRSSDPFEMPLIDPKYFNNKEDYVDSVKACMTILDMMSSDVWAKLKPEPYSPNDFCKGMVGKEYCKCAVKYYSKSMYHATGTARMANDRKRGVVTPTLKVWGISNLRVIDASVMPNITSGNTNAPTIMIAERGATIIKKKWNKPAV